MLAGSAELEDRVSHRERDGNYHAVVAQLNEHWRIISCRDGIQWILQSKRSKARIEWQGRSYFRRRDAMIRQSADLAGEISPSAREILEALPERHPEKTVVSNVVRWR